MCFVCLLGTCSQMLRIKNKATQNVRCYRPSSYETLFLLGYNDLQTKGHEGHTFMIAVCVNKRKSMRNIRDNINNHVTSSIHSHSLIIEK
jgi:ribosomal protein L32E